MTTILYFFWTGFSGVAPVAITPDVIFMLEPRYTTFGLDPRSTTFVLEERPTTFGE